MTEPGFDRQPPQDLAAEQSVLGAMLLSKEAIADVVPVLRPDDFYRPSHRNLYDVIADLYRRDQPVDAVLMANELRNRAMLVKVGGLPYLHTLISSVSTAANALYYAEIIAEKASLRRLIEAGTRIVQLGYADVDRDQVDEVVIRARSALDDAIGAEVVEHGSTSVGDLLSEPEQAADWVVPDLLERGDRLILTGSEGLGKSVMISQFAMCVAGGLHPFTGEPLWADGGTGRVLIVDVENTRRQLRRRLIRLSTVIDGLRRRHGLDPVDWRDVARVVIRPDGVDLGKPAEVARLTRECTAMAPDLLLAGPLYKMTGYNTHEEEGALRLLKTLDHLRVTHNCALVSEHHMPHAQNGQVRSTRPIGSSAFLRWPEFGLGIVAHPNGDPEQEHPRWVQVRRWRGGREERDWPRELRYGPRDHLPWVPAED